MKWLELLLVAGVTLVSAVTVVVLYLRKVVKPQYPGVDQPRG